MDSFERMNEVIAYIEENIAGDIDFSRISRIAYQREVYTGKRFESQRAKVKCT